MRSYPHWELVGLFEPWRVSKKMATHPRGMRNSTFLFGRTWTFPHLWMALVLFDDPAPLQTPVSKVVTSCAPISSPIPARRAVSPHCIVLSGWIALKLSCSRFIETASSTLNMKMLEYLNAFRVEGFSHFLACYSMRMFCGLAVMGHTSRLYIREGQAKTCICKTQIDILQYAICYCSDIREWFCQRIFEQLLEGIPIYQISTLWLLS